MVDKRAHTHTHILRGHVMGVHRIDFPSVLSSAEDKAFVKGYSDTKTSDDRL